MMNSDIDKTSECCDIGDDPDELHALSEVVDSADVLVEFKHFERLAGVASGFLQLVDDVVDGDRKSVV